MKQFIIEKGDLIMHYEAFELTVPNTGITSDIMAVFACYYVSQEMKLVGYMYGVSLMTDDEIMTELERMAGEHFRPYYCIRKEYRSRFDGTCNGIVYMDEEFGDEEQAREYAEYLNANETTITKNEYTCYSIDAFNESDDEFLGGISAEELLPADEFSK